MKNGGEKEKKRTTLHFADGQTKNVKKRSHQSILHIDFFVWQIRWRDGTAMIRWRKAFANVARTQAYLNIASLQLRENKKL